MPRRTIRIDDEDWILLERMGKKEGFASNNEMISFLVKQKITGGSINPELTVKQQTEKIKLEILEIKKPTEKINKLSKTLKLWKEAKSEGYTLEQYYGMVNDGKIENPESNFTITPFEKSKQFKLYGTTTIHTKKEEKSDGIDENNFCDTCNHTHADIEPKVCKEIHCNCGIRG